jgi:hypothetical protein
MFNKELPTEVWVFAGVGMKRRNLRHFRGIPSARLQHKHTKAILSEITGKRSAARARTHNDEVVLCSFLFWMKTVSHLNEHTPQPSGAVG